MIIISNLQTYIQTTIGWKVFVQISSDTIPTHQNLFTNEKQQKLNDCICSEQSDPR